MKGNVSSILSPVWLLPSRLNRLTPRNTSTRSSLMGQDFRNNNYFPEDKAIETEIQKEYELETCR